MARHNNRRRFLHGAGLLAAGVIFPEVKSLALQEKRSGVEAEEVSPTEDLMREYGVLNRILLVYEEIGRRLTAKAGFDSKVLASAAGIIRHFIEDYHEKLEEDYLFPRFEKANKLTDLVRVLREQHQAGRQVTAQIQGLSRPSGVRDSENRQKLLRSLHSFIRMYRPHEAREDTILFPALHGLVSRNEYDSLGEEFEKQERELLGADGFEKMVDQVAGLEKTLGIYDLARFTPR